MRCRLTFPVATAPVESRTRRQPMNTGSKLPSALALGVLLLSGGAPVAQEYEFKGGYPTPETILKAYDDADLSRAIQAYKFFYPTVSFEGTWRGNLKEGVVANQVFALLEGT